MSSSEVFSLEGQALKLDSADDINKHVEALRSDPTAIKSFLLQGNTIGVGASTALAPILSSLTNLTTANLADIFTARLLSEIPPALDSLLTSLLPLQHLHTVNLSDNAFGLNTAAPLVKFLAQHTPLQHLILNNNGLGPEAGKLVATSLSQLAVLQQEKRVPGLATIVCGRNRLENGSMEAWATAVAAHRNSLREIKMVQNGIRQEGIQTLLRSGLGKATRLQVLDLQDNTFTASGSAALAEVVSGWTNLKELGVGDCLISARGMFMLLNAFAKGSNKNLEVLRCQYGEVDAAAVRLLADLLEGDRDDKAGEGSVLPKLRRIELNGNKFNEEDPNVDRLRDVLEARKDNSGVEGEDESWGLDELSDLEDDSEEDEDEADEDEDDDDTEEKADALLKQADQAENENVALEKDSDVDALADKLGKTEI